MKRLYVYVDASVVGGCEDIEFGRRPALGTSAMGTVRSRCSRSIRCGISKAHRRRACPSTGDPKPVAILTDTPDVRCSGEMRTWPMVSLGQGAGPTPFTWRSQQWACRRFR